METLERTIQIGTHKRAAAISSVDVEARTATFSFSSEEPVRMWDWDLGEFYEILDHSGQSANLDRMNNGGPYLWNHDRDDQRGVILRAWIKDARGYATAKLSRTQAGQDLLLDLADEIRTCASFMYVPSEYRLEGTAADGLKIFRAMTWEVYEISSVSIPADPSVGLGRSITDQEKASLRSIKVRGLAADMQAAFSDQLKAYGMPEKEPKEAIQSVTPEGVEHSGGNNEPLTIEVEITLGDDDDESEPSPETDLERGKKMPEIVITKEHREQIQREERDRITGIRSICQTFGKSEMAQSLIDSGADLNQAREKIMDTMQGRANDIQTGSVELGFSEKEEKQYSLCRALLSMAEPETKKQASFEIDVHQELQRQLKREPKTPGALFLPLRDLKAVSYSRQAMDKISESIQRGDYQSAMNMMNRATYTTTAANGGNTVQTNIQPLIEILRNKMMVRMMGATVLSGLSGNVAFPRQNATATAYWTAEGGTITQSESTFAQFVMSPKTLTGLSAYSKQLLAQSSIDVEGFVRNDLMQVTAVALDLASLSGSGTSNQPTGIINQAGVGTVAIGTNGGAPTWVNCVVPLETAVGALNADTGSLGYLVNAKTRGTFKTTLKFAVNGATPIWEAGQLLDMPGTGTVNGYRAGVTNQLRSNLTKGSGTALSELIFGDWSALFIGMWDGMEILSNPFGTGFPAGLIQVRAFNLCDINLRRVESFAFTSDALAA